MQIFKIRGIHIDGICACVPEKRMDNAETLREMYGDETEKIIRSTGIRTRYIAEKGTTSGDLCLSCAEELLQGTGTDRDEIGGVIFVTFTPDHRMPFNAAEVQERLGLSREIPAFDISLACSGYTYGLYVASMFARAGRKKILLLDGDVQSAFVSASDKATVPVLADAGSATLLSADDSEDEWSFTFYTDGTGRELLMIPAGGSASPICAEDLAYRECEDGGRRRNIDIKMDGFGIYRFVAQDISKWLERFLEECGQDSRTIDFFVPHQANMYMIRQLSRKLKFAWERTWQSGGELGNSASATIPVTIAKCAGDALKTEGDNRLLISGFGAGLSAAAGLITLSAKAFYSLYQYQSLL